MPAELSLPAIIVAGTALDPVIDFADLGVDTVSLFQHMAIYKEVSENNQKVNWFLFLYILSEVKKTLTDFADLSLLEQIHLSLYSAEIANRNLGNALNFPRNLQVLEDDENYVVQKIDSPTTFSDSWEFIMDMLDDVLFDNNLRWNWDFSSFIQFRDDTGINKLWLSNELKYVNAKFPRD